MKALIVIPSLVLVLTHLDHPAGGKKLDGLPEPDQPSQTILIITSFDAMSIKARNNKKELFRELTEKLSGYLSEAIGTQTNYIPVVVPGILNKSFPADSLVYSLMQQHHAVNAILIRSLDVFFEDSGSKEETGDDGKPRTITSYNLCVKNEYWLYNSHEKLKQSVTDYCEFFTTRSVKGRFAIQFGPDIVGKSKHTYEPVAKNAANYIQSIGPLLKEPA
jgi:hypothetical protein